MKKKHKRIAVKVIKILCVITACAGLFCLVGFIGNVDYCTEIGAESEVGLPHLLISSAVFVAGIIAYKIAGKAAELI